MSLLLLLHLVATAAYCCLLWLVQLVIYPQFTRVPPEALAAYHREHMRGIGWVVAPLFLLEGSTALLVAIALFHLQPWLQIASLALFLAGTAVTFGIFVPLHRRLEKELPPPSEWALLTRLNRMRTALSSARLLVVVLISSKAFSHVL